jgi:RND family efflux transporter MFP subunit
LSTTSLRSELASLRINRARSTRGSLLAKIAVFLSALVLLAGLGGGGYLLVKDRLDPPPEVRTDVVRIMSGRQVATVLSATGYLESRYQASVGAKVPGRLAKVLVEEGDVVSEGDLLAELEHLDLDAQLASRSAAVKEAEADLAESRHNLVQRDRDYRREQELQAQRAGTLAALETAETAFKAAEVRVQALEAALAAANSRENEAVVAIDYMKIYAPFGGTVIAKDADAGETIMPGGMGLASGRGSVATIADLTHLEVDTDVKEDFLNRIEHNQPCEIMVDAAAGRTYHGRVRQIIPIGDRSRGIVKVKVEVLDADDRLFPDLSATVHFQPIAADAAATAPERSTYVPENAIVSSGDDHSVWTVVDGRVRKVTVTPVGYPVDGRLAVEGDLDGGETVVVDPPGGLVEGGKVRVAP